MELLGHTHAVKENLTDDQGVSVLFSTGPLHTGSKRWPRTGRKSLNEHETNLRGGGLKMALPPRHGLPVGFWSARGTIFTLRLGRGALLFLFG